jgi:dihydrofolate reductase
VSKTFSIVAARSDNNVIGNGSDIPWQVKGEQALFKEITLGGCLLMGRKTYESIGRPLPGRKTIILSRDDRYRQDGCLTATSLAAAMVTAAATDRPIFVVGGGQIYTEALPEATELHLTTIHTEVDGDVFFPHFEPAEFHLISSKKIHSNINYSYAHWRRNKGD